MKNTELMKARQSARLTALELAERARTSELRIYAFERGRYKPREGEAERIAAALRTSPAKLGFTEGEATR